MNAEPENNLQRDSEVVCPHCLRANASSMAFCIDCGAPLGMVSTLDPVQQIYSEGFAYRSAVEGPPKLIVIIGIWLLFLPMAVMALLMFLEVGGRGSGIQTPILFIASVGVLFRVTWNYVVKSRAAKKLSEDSRKN